MLCPALFTPQWAVAAPAQKLPRRNRTYSNKNNVGVSRRPAVGEAVEVGAAVLCPATPVPSHRHR